MTIRSGRVTSGPPDPELVRRVAEMLKPSLAELPARLREAFRRVYSNNESALAVCSDLEISYSEFSEAQSNLRRQFLQLRARTSCKPPVSSAKQSSGIARATFSLTDFRKDLSAQRASLRNTIANRERALGIRRIEQNAVSFCHEVMVLPRDPSHKSRWIRHRDVRLRWATSRFSKSPH